MPGDAGVTVVTMLVCLFFIAYEAAGASRARHSLRPLTKRVRKFLANLARMGGEIAKPWLRTMLRFESTASSPRPVYAGGFAGLQCQSAEALAKAGTRGPITPNGVVATRSLSKSSTPSGTSAARRGSPRPVRNCALGGDDVEGLRKMARSRYTFVAIATNISGTDMNFPLLFSPLKIGPYRLKHRRCGRL
jgi:hypothetical protein